jgi:hypothetical protein
LGRSLCVVGDIHVKGKVFRILFILSANKC